MAREGAGQPGRGGAGHPRARLAGWIAGGLLLGSLVGAVALVLAVSAGWQREELTRQVERWVQDAAGIEVSIADLEGPLYPSLELRGLRLGSGETSLAAVDSVAIEWSLAVWPPAVEVHQLALRAPRVSLRRGQDGAWNLGGSGETEAPQSPDAPGWRTGGITIHSLTWVDGRVRIDAGTASPAWSLSAASDGALRDLDLPWTRASAEALSGEAELVFEPWGAAALLDGGRLRAERSRGQPARVEGDVRGPAGRAAVSGRAAWPGVPGAGEGIDAQVRLDVAELDASRLPGGTPVETQIEGAVDLEATGGLLDSGVPELVTFALELGVSRVGAARVEAATLRGEVRDGWWRLTEGRARGTGIELDATGSGQGDRLAALALDLRLDSLETLLRGWGDEGRVSGRVEARAELAGPVGEPSGPVAVQARDLVLGGIGLGELVGRLRVERGVRAEIDELTLSGGALELRADPGAALRREGEGVAIDALALAGSGQSLTLDGWIGPESMRALSLDVSRADLTTWSRLLDLDPGPGGVVSGTLRADGPLDDPTASAEFEWADAAWAGTALGQLSGSATARSRRLELRGLLQAGETETFELTGAAAIPSAAGDPEAWLRRSDDRIEVRGRRVELARIAPFLPEEVRHPRGEVALVLSLRGGRDRVVEGWLELEDGWIDVVALGETFGPVQGRVGVEDTLLRIEDVSVGPAGEQAVVRGSVALGEGARPESLDLAVVVSQLPLERVPLPRKEDEEPAEVATGGRLDAELRLKGAVAAPRLSGTLDWTSPRWQSVVLERITAELDGTPEVVEARARMFYASREVASLQARLPVPDDPASPLDWLADDEAAIEVRGDDLDFALLEPFLPRLVRRPRGLADVALRIEGGEPEPFVDGTVVVREGSVQVPALRQTFSPIAGRARFDGSVLSIESVVVGSSEAGARLSGTVELVDMRPAEAEIDVRFDGFPLARSPVLRTDVDGSLRLAGSLDAPSLTGDLVLRNGRLTVRDADDPAMKEVRIATESGPGSVRETAPTTGAFERAEVDVSVTVPRNTWIRTRDMELDVEGGGRVRKRSIGEPRISGSLDVVRGTVRFELRRFVVRSGSATLDGGSELDPLLDVEAEYPVADVVIVAYLTGRASSPRLRLESEPPLPQDDVVSYLIFGRPASQLGASEQGGVNAAAAGLAAGLALAELRQIMGDQFPVDTIDLSIGEGSEASRLEVGKYVGRDLFVRYGQSFGPESEQEVGISYRLNENWTLESSTGTDATAGADIFWSIEY